MKQPLLIVHLDCGRVWGGGQAQVFLLLEGLHTSGHRNILLCRESCPLAKKAEAAGAASVAKVRFGVITMPTVVNALRRVCETEQVDLIHLHDSRSHSIGALFAARSEDRPPIVVSRRVAFGGSPSSFSRWKYRYGADHYVAISQAAAKSVLAHGVPEEKITIVPSCYLEEPGLQRKGSQRLRRPLGLNRRTKLIGTIGGLTKVKGHTVLLDAFKAILDGGADAFLVIAGEGQERASLEAQLQELGIEHRVALLGFVEDLGPLYEDLDVFVLPSFSEGLNTSLLQAMAWAIPCVASDVGGIPEAITDASEGLLVAAQDAHALSRAIQRLLDNPQEAQAFAAAARRKATDRFSKARMVSGTASVYQKVLTASE